MPELEAFFHDLRALRASAGLSMAELAERAHFPEETLAAADADEPSATTPSPLLYRRRIGCSSRSGMCRQRSSKKSTIDDKRVRL